MAILKVQTLALGTTGSGSTQQTGAAASNPTVGNYLVALAWGWSNTHAPTHVTWSDTAGNTWVVPTGAFASVTNDLWLAGAYVKVATTGASFKVTAGPQDAGNIGSTGSICVVAAEFSGIPASSPQDGSVTSSAPGTTANSGMQPGSLTITSGSLVVGVFSNDDGNSPWAHINGTVGTAATSPSPGTAPTGFTALGSCYDGSNIQVGQAAYAINPSSPSNPSWSTSADTAAKWGAMQFALLAVATTSFPGDEDEGVFYQPYVTWQERARERLRGILLPEPAWSVRMAKQRQGAA